MRRFLTAAAFVAAAGCATGYHRQSFSGGYSDLQLADNLFQVRFKGNGYTSRDRVADFALLRCAEVSLANGFPYFAIVANRSSTSTYTSDPTPTVTTAQATAFGKTVYGQSVTTGGDTYTIVKAAEQNTVLGLKEKPRGFAYESAVVIRSIRERYGMQERP